MNLFRSNQAMLKDLQCPVLLIHGRPGSPGFFLWGVGGWNWGWNIDLWLWNQFFPFNYGELGKTVECLSDIIDVYIKRLSLMIRNEWSLKMLYIRLVFLEGVLRSSRCLLSSWVSCEVKNNFPKKNVKELWRSQSTKATCRWWKNGFEISSILLSFKRIVSLKIMAILYRLLSTQLMWSPKPPITLGWGCILEDSSFDEGLRTYRSCASIFLLRWMFVTFYILSTIIVSTIDGKNLHHFFCLRKLLKHGIFCISTG